ncbi:MAG: DUF1684 domain-containing protein [Acidobacteria bacterium]|nr:DUF1684 domain-containing protein [Acidobacteriota bacterium]
MLPLLLVLLALGPYVPRIEEWRRKAEAALGTDDGWLTVAGLYWLKEGENRFGTAEGLAIVLPPGSAPAEAGVFKFRAGRTTVTFAPGVAAMVNGRPAASAELKPDSAGKPDLVALGGLTMFVIQRGDRYGIRLRDRNSRFRREFTGRKWFPVNEDYRIEARFVPYDPPRKLAVPNVLGQKDEMPSPGRVIFRWQGRELSLEPVVSDQRLWFIFKDGTAGKETYPAGRFLYAGAPVNGTVILDFNQAVNPPCAFTPYATCPLPPRRNWLPVRIEAGELTYHAAP